jgi:hypothetical protein
MVLESDVSVEVSGKAASVNAESMNVVSKSTASAGSEVDESSFPQADRRTKHVERVRSRRGCMKVPPGAQRVFRGM